MCAEAALAAVVTQVIHPQPRKGGGNRAACLSCGFRGHFARNRPAAPVRAAWPLWVPLVFVEGVDEVITG